MSLVSCLKQWKFFNILSTYSYNLMSVGRYDKWTESGILKFAKYNVLLFPGVGICMNKENLKYFYKIHLPDIF